MNKSPTRGTVSPTKRTTNSAFSSPTRSPINDNIKFLSNLNLNNNFVSSHGGGGGGGARSGSVDQLLSHYQNANISEHPSRRLASPPGRGDGGGGGSSNPLQLPKKPEPKRQPLVANVSSLAKINAAAKMMAASVPSSPQKRVYPVYLRPEQNIPDIFAHSESKFAPITSREDEKEAGRRRRRGRSVDRGDFKGDKAGANAGISRDDIVVTVRSAQV